MKEKTAKIITLAGLGIAVLSTVLAIMFALKVPSTVKNLLDLTMYETESGESVSFFFDLTYWILIALVAVSVAAILFFLILKLVNRFTSEKGYLFKFLIILGICIVVVVISYVLSTGNDVNDAKLALIDDNKETAIGISKFIGAACYMVYILVFGAAACILYSEIVKSIKKKA